MEAILNIIMVEKFPEQMIDAKLKIKKCNDSQTGYYIYIHYNEIADTKIKKPETIKQNTNLQK